MTTVVEAMTALLEDDSVAEIMVDGPDRVYVERRGKLEDTDVCFAGDQQVIDWANSLLTLHGWSPVGEGRPWMDARLQDCLLYTSPSPRDRTRSRMPSSA